MRTASSAMIGAGAILILILGAMVPSLMAQDLVQPAGSLGYESYIGYAGQDTTSPSDRPVAKVAPPAAVPQATVPQTTAPDAGCARCGSCDTGRTCRWCNNGTLAEPWTLPQLCALQRRGVEVHGWMSAGVLGNGYDAKNNGTLGFNPYTDVNLHQMVLYAERKVSTEERCWDIGGRIDYMFGIDGPRTQATGDQGWDYTWDSSSRYGSAIPQAYGEFALGQWTVKAGRFYTPIGYEVVSATGNFFYSHSYTNFYGEPFTHTGVVISRKIGDKLTAFGGYTDGWDSSFNNYNGADTFLGGMTYEMSEKISLAWACTAGNWGLGNTLGDGATGSNGRIYMNSWVLTMKPTDRWTYIVQHDLGINTDNGGADTHWYGVNQYLLYKINDCWSAGGRFEWFRDEDGARVIVGNPGSYYETTVGLNYKPHSNVTLRPEIRYDYYKGEVGAGGLPFNYGTRGNQISYGLDAVITF